MCYGEGKTIKGKVATIYAQKMTKAERESKLHNNNNNQTPLDWVNYIDQSTPLGSTKNQIFNKTIHSVSLDGFS